MWRTWWWTAASAAPGTPMRPIGRTALSIPTPSDAYLHLIAQSRSAWTQELDLRPWTERF